MASYWFASKDSANPNREPSSSEIVSPNCLIISSTSVSSLLTNLKVLAWALVNGFFSTTTTSYVETSFTTYLDTSLLSSFFSSIPLPGRYGQGFLGGPEDRDRVEEMVDIDRFEETEEEDLVLEVVEVVTSKLLLPSSEESISINPYSPNLLVT